MFVRWCYVTCLLLPFCPAAPCAVPLAMSVSVLQVCQTIAEAFPGLREAVAWELILAVLAVAQDATQEVRSLGLLLLSTASQHVSQRASCLEHCCSIIIVERHCKFHNMRKQMLLPVCVRCRPPVKCWPCRMAAALQL